MAKWQVLTLSVSAAHMSCTGWAVKEKQLGRERGCGYCLGDLEIKQGLFSFLFFPLFFLEFPSKPFLLHKTCYYVVPVCCYLFWQELLPLKLTFLSPVCSLLVWRLFSLYLPHILFGVLLSQHLEQSFLGSYRALLLIHSWSSYK